MHIGGYFSQDTKETNKSFHPHEVLHCICMSESVVTCPLKSSFQRALNPFRFVYNFIRAISGSRRSHLITLGHWSSVSEEPSWLVQESVGLLWAR